MVALCASYGTSVQRQTSLSEGIMQSYLHIALGGVRSIQQRFVSSPFNWKAALKIEEFKRQVIECR